MRRSAWAASTSLPHPVGFGGYPARIARAPGGGYRVMAHGPQAPVTGGSSSSCSVFGLTDTGVLDAGFGVAGIAAAPLDAATTRASSIANPWPCKAMVAFCWAVANNDAVGGGYIGRLLATGAADSSFHPDPGGSEIVGQVLCARRRIHRFDLRHRTGPNGVFRSAGGPPPRRRYARHVVRPCGRGHVRPECQARRPIHRQRHEGDSQRRARRCRQCVLVLRSA